MFRGYSTVRANGMYADNLAVVTEAEPAAGPLAPVERSAYFSPEISGVALYADETHLCFGDDSNSWRSQDGWSELVLLDLEGAAGIQEVGRVTCQNPWPTSRCIASTAPRNWYSSPRAQS